MKVRALEVDKKWDEGDCGCRGEVAETVLVVLCRSWELGVVSSHTWTSVSTRIFRGTTGSLMSKMSRLRIFEELGVEEVVVVGS